MPVHLGKLSCSAEAEAGDVGGAVEVRVVGLFPSGGPIYTLSDFVAVDWEQIAFMNSFIRPVPGM